VSESNLRLAVGLLLLLDLTLSRLDWPPGVLKMREPAAALGEPCCLLPGVLMPWMRVMFAVLPCCLGLKRDDVDSGRDAKGIGSRGREGGV
jgi:hypothetical protein